MNCINCNQIKKIDEKLNIIGNEILRKNNFEDIGLFSGNTGLLIFLSNYTKHTNNEKYYNFAISLIEKNIVLINEGLSLYTFSSGISGFLWGLIYLSENDFIDIENISGLLNDLDDYLYKKMMIDIKEGNYDYLHGAVGVGIYFLKRVENSKNAKKYLTELVDELEKQSHKEDDGCLKWLSVVNHETGEQGYNLSLSHGITSIIAFLGKLYDKNIYREKVSLLLKGSIKYLLINMLDSSKYGFHFPGYINANCSLTGGRLSWCYYDLGTAVVLYNIGKIINDIDIQNKGIEILLYSSTKREVQSPGIVDAGLCHGTSGIAHIYYRMFFNTGIVEFKETSNYWFEETLKMAYHNDGLAGFKAWHSEKFGGWVNEYGILEGVSGIGLAMLSWITQTEPTWDECLLLS